MKTWKKFLLGLIGIFLLIQLPFFRPELNHSTDSPDNDIAMHYSLDEIPMHIIMDLGAACYDCHSNYTTYTKLDVETGETDTLWYRNIQPISWWMNLHVQKGKEALNFSEFALLSEEEKAEAFLKIQEVMEERTMPLKSYNLTHGEGILTDEQYEDMAKWAETMRDRILNPEKYIVDENSEDDGSFMGFDDDFDEEAYIKALEEAAEKGTEIEWDE